MFEDGYEIVDSLSAALDTEKYHKMREQALDRLFNEPQEGQLRARPDGSLELFSNGKWITP